MKRIHKFLLAFLCLTLLTGMACAASAQGVSQHGAYAVRVGQTVFASIYNGTGYTLYSVPSAGGDMTALETDAEISDLIAVDNTLYYLRNNGASCVIARRAEDGDDETLYEFENGVQVSNLSWYDEVLYCLADEHLYIVDPNGDGAMLCDEKADDYVIVSDVIFYVSSGSQLTYERTVTGETEPLTQTAGTLWSMSILGTNPEQLLAKGVDTLRAHDDNLFFHNLEDNYVMGSTENMWLEGKLYRYNIQTGQMASLGLDYDWDFYPEDAGLLVYTSGDLSLYPLTGGEPTQLMAPELRTSVTAQGDTAYVYEYNSQRFTALPLDGTAETVLFDDSNVLPDVENGDDQETISPLADNPDGVDDEVDEGEDTPADEDDLEAESLEDDDSESSSSSSSGSTKTGGYIFPNSSSKKLTRKQVLAISKSKWGYARNEIYARHGYVFKTAKYKKYFSAKSWYKPGGFSTSSLNSIEWYNMELIKSLEREYGLLPKSSGGSGSSGGSNSSAKNNYYVLKEASSKKLTKSYLRKKLGSKSKYALARNEILARHGYVFKTAKYKKYFNNQKWYKPGGYSSSKVSATEWHNIKLLKQLEAE